MSHRNAFGRVLVYGAMACAGMAAAQTPASVPYTPSWTARHHVQWLIDHEGLELLGSQWPLPAAAVERALDALDAGAVSAWGLNARRLVRQELEALKSETLLSVHVRTEAEGLNGFGDNHAPGSRAWLAWPEVRHSLGTVSLAGKLGMRAEAVPAALRGWNDSSAYQLSPDGSAAVLGIGGWQLQAFAHRHWWGPGWQSSLINGHNQPGWRGVGLQRGATAPSPSTWASWMGPWNLDVFVAKAQDPLLFDNQPQGFWFSGMRLTIQPKPWLEIGLSRGLQTGGQGRPNGAGNFVKAFLGQEVNKNPEDTFTDSSAQIAGYDVRITCPRSVSGFMGVCAAYTQWMGEDAAGHLPLPFKFMSLWGVESTYGQGQYRVFAEWTNTNTYSLPWDTKPSFPGYLNGVYVQGFTQGARWVGSAQGAGSRVLTLGWMDAAKQRLLKLHVGKIHTGVGAYNPRWQAPTGDFWGFSAQQTAGWRNLQLTPELALIRFPQGHDERLGGRQVMRVGIDIRTAF